VSKIAEIKNIDNKNERLSALSEISITGLQTSDIQELIEFFSDPYWPVREAVSKKLLALGPGVSEHLISAISSPNEDIRFWSAQVLSFIADDRAIELLINSFPAYEDNDINLYSARSLIKIGDKSSPHLVASLASQNDLIRLYSVYCLGELAFSDAASPIEKMLLSDANFAVRRNAAVALGKISSRSSIEPLINAISDKSWNVRIAATEALGKFKDFIDSANSSGAEAVAFHDRITNTLLSSLSDTEARVRETGARVLSSFGDKFVEEPLLKLLETSVSDGEKMIAVKSLGELETKNAVYALEGLFGKTDSVELKKEIVMALGRIGDVKSIGVILSAVASENIELSVAGVNSVFLIRDEAVTAELSALLEDAREEVRAAVASALGRTNFIDARKYLYSALEDSSYIVRRQALISLHSILGDEILSDAISLISDPEEMVVIEAISITARIRSIDALPALSKAIERGPNRVAYMAFQALAAIGSGAEYVALRHLASQNRDICYWAIDALEKIGSGNCVEPLIEVIKKRNSEEQIVDRALNVLLQFDFNIDDKFFVEILKSTRISQHKIIEILGKSSNGAIAVEIIPFLHSTDREVRFCAAVSLGRLGNSSDEVVSGLVEALKDKHWPVRKASAESLASLGPKASKRLIAELDRESANADIVYWSLRSLADSGVREAVPSLKKYASSKNADVKKIVIKGFGKIADPDSIDELIKFLNDDNSEIRFHAVKALKDVKDPRVLEHLIKKMNDDYDNVRSFAAIALGNFKDESAANALKKALTDSSHWVVKYARESLSKILN